MVGMARRVVPDRYGVSPAENKQSDLFPKQQEDISFRNVSRCFDLRECSCSSPHNLKDCRTKYRKTRKAGLCGMQRPAFGLIFGFQGRTVIILRTGELPCGSGRDLSVPRKFPKRADCHFGQPQRETVAVKRYPLSEPESDTPDRSLSGALPSRDCPPWWLHQREGLVLQPAR